jgi:uncharacterized protein (TIGR03437 family)
VLSAWSLRAQPGISQNGVVNRASQIPSTLAGGPIARGALFEIRGVRFGAAATVSIRKGSAVSPIKVLAVQPEQIQAIMPDAAPLGPAELTVTSAGSSGKPFAIAIEASNPGIFSQNKHGWGPGQIENIDAQGKRTLNAIASPAAPGQRVAMKITGLGKGVPAIVVVGNRTVNAGAARMTPQPGEQEISFVIPNDVAAGCYAPVYLLALPTRASNVVTMSIQSAANRTGKCDSGAVPLLDAKRIGMAVITRTTMDKFGLRSENGEAIATFTVRDPGRTFSPLLLLPPPGTCTAYTSTLQDMTSLPGTISALLFGDLGPEGLAAGPQLMIGQENRRRPIPGERDAAGYYHAHLPPPLLDAGKFFLQGPGGLDVGAFRVTAQIPPPLERIGSDDDTIVERSRGLELHWRGGGSGYVTVLVATNVDQGSTAVGTVLCAAPVNATHCQMPPALLANIPASPTIRGGAPYDQLFLASLPLKATPIVAPGLGAGALFTIYATSRVVEYH